MKDYVKNKLGCRRSLLLKPFACTSNYTSNLDAKHSCCDVCAESCRCTCSCNSPNSCECTNPCPKEMYKPTIVIVLQRLHSKKRCETLEAKEVTNNISEEQYALLYDRLMAYRSELANHCSHEKLLTGLDCATGYSLM